MQQIGIYRYYNLQHLNSGPASNIISNQLLVDSIPKCMPSGTRSNKEKYLLFSDDSAHLERTIRRGQHSTSLDATTSSLIDTHNQPSTDIRPSSSIDPNRSTTIDTTPRTSIDTVSSKMVNIIILTHDENGNLYDQNGHLRNATCQKIDAQGTIGHLAMVPAKAPFRTYAGLYNTLHGQSVWYGEKHEPRLKRSERSDFQAGSAPCTDPWTAVYHPPSPFYDKIDRSVDQTIDRQSESDVDRHNTPPIDRHAPLTYRVWLPSIDNDYINALRPPPKPLANPPDPKPNPLNWRRLRKRKEKIPKNLKRKANDKEMDGFTKRILRIPIEKAFDELTSHTELGFIGVCHCGAEYETEYLESIDTHTFPSIDSNESTVTDDRNNTSLDVNQPVDHFAPPNHWYPHFAFQPPSKRGCDDYSIGSWEDSGFHESFAVDTMKDLNTHKFTTTFPTSFDEVHSTSVDTHPRPAKQPFTSIDTHTRTSIDIRAAAKIQEQENIPSPTRFIDTYLKRFVPLQPPPHTRANTQAEKMNTLPSTSTGKFMESNHLKNTSSAEIILPSIDASGPKWQRTCNRWKDLTSVQREHSRYPSSGQWTDNLFSQQPGTPDVIQTDPNKHIGVATTEINPDLSCHPKGQASINGTTQTSIDRLTPTSTDKDDPTSIDRRYEFGNRAYDMYGARKFTWERRDKYGVYRDECGHAQGIAGEMIHVTKDDIRKLLERASLFEESHICLPEHATSFTLTRLAPELYTKDEINEMVTGICGAQEKLGEELKSLVEDTHQPLDRDYNELFRSMEATTSASIDATHAPSIDVSLPTAQIPAEPQCSAEHKDEWEVLKASSSSIDRLRGSWIDGKNPVELLPYTAAEVDKITSMIYTAIGTMEERPDIRCDDIYFPFDNRISGLDSHAEWLQKEVKAIQRQLAAQHQIPASIDRNKRNRSMVSRRDRPTNT
ncbi:hypothetical protein IGI04_026075 [Brassica rapa subsp. trilocularis]|uniref:Uncharacterized protein n=1 Tax=Brassica rapa subsp. trilocularis TaxID=1813537 RepID=A0ABQ7KUX6_BRACM|nr:hypothetical protein IGI04_026075 [Brassica rapa subsp. trilocularis]